MTNAPILSKFLFSYSKHYHVLQLLQPQPLTSRVCRPKKEMESVQEETFPAPEALTADSQRKNVRNPASLLPPSLLLQLLNKKKKQFLKGFLLGAHGVMFSPVFLHPTQSYLLRITETTRNCLTRNCGANTDISRRLCPD